MLEIGRLKVRDGSARCVGGSHEIDYPSSGWLNEAPIDFALCSN